MRVWRVEPVPVVEGAPRTDEPEMDAAVLGRARWPAEAAVGFVAVDERAESDKLARGLLVGVVGVFGGLAVDLVEAVDALRPLGADAVVRARAAAVVVVLDGAVLDPAARTEGTGGLVVLGRTRGVDVAGAPGPMLARGPLEADAAVGAAAVLDVRERGRVTGELGPVEDELDVLGRGGGTFFSSCAAVRAAEAAVGAVSGRRFASESLGVDDVVELAFETGRRTLPTALGDAAR